MQKVRLDGIQVPITQLLPNRFQCNPQHCVDLSILRPNIIAKFLFERQNQTKKMVEKRFLFQVVCMQNKTGLNICRIALQMIALFKIDKNPGPNRSGINELKFPGSKTAKTYGSLPPAESKNRICKKLKKLLLYYSCC